MALTEYQATIIRLLAERRKRDGVSYIAGGTALNEALKASRRSSDIDIFHDTTEALRSTWAADKKTLCESGYEIDMVRENPSFVEVVVKKNGGQVLIQWVRDSAYRFFPLIEDPLMGLTLHPIDLATNKILAMAGRLEPRDWIDAIECCRTLQPLGYLVWAAVGKDPGINPEMLLADAARLHYSQADIDTLDFGAEKHAVAALSVEWKQHIISAKQLVDMLPPDHLGACLLEKNASSLYAGSFEVLGSDLAAENILFHHGCIGGAWPVVVE